MDQEDKLDGGACGGDEGQDASDTSVKHVPAGFYSGATAVPIEDGRPPLSGNHDRLLPNEIAVDVDLRDEIGNKEMARTCNKTYVEEKTYEQSQKSALMTMPLNIPVPDECKKEKNIPQLELTMAEHQTSFQSIQSGGEGFPAMSLNCEDNTQVNGKVTSPDNNAVVTSHTGATHGFPMGMGHDNNCSNGGSSVRHMLPNNLSHSQQSNTNNSRSSNTTSGSRYSRRPRVRITDNTLVVNCPPTLIRLLGTHFNGKGGNNWEALLGHYHWNYRDICLFANANRNHSRGYFCAILEEQDFQEYTVGQLRDDLCGIPKRDTLQHMNEWIDNYNTSDSC